MVKPSQNKATPVAAPAAESSSDDSSDSESDAELAPVEFVEDTEGSNKAQEPSTSSSDSSSSEDDNNSNSDSGSSTSSAGEERDTESESEDDTLTLVPGKANPAELSAVPSDDDDDDDSSDNAERKVTDGTDQNDGRADSDDVEVQYMMDTDPTCSADPFE